MNRHGFFITICLCILTIEPTSAQESSWPLEERCATPAQAGAWSYDGTILATGYGGLHGISAAWDTPRVVARSGRNPSGVLSPNNRWYAVRKEHVIYAESYNHEHVIDAIQVYSTLDDNVVYSISWQNSWLNMWGYRELFWLDNEHILYERSEEFVHELEEIVILNPFDESTESWNAQIDVLDGGSGFYREFVQFPSPDFTRTVYYRYDSDRNLFYWALYDLTTGEELIKVETTDAVFSWLPDSSGYAAAITNDEKTKLMSYDRFGESAVILLELGSANIQSPQDMIFAPNGQLLAFRPSADTLYIADMQGQAIFNTCLSISTGFSWSPGSHQLSFLESGNGTQDVYVLDLDSWSYRAIARHIVLDNYRDRIIGWRED